MTYAPLQPAQTLPGEATRAPKLVNHLIWLMMAMSSISFIEPSPSDIFLIPLMLVVFVTGFRILPAHVPIIFLMLMRMFSEIFALMPFLNDPDAVTYVVYTVVVSIVCLFCVVLFSSNTQDRIRYFLNGYLASCLIASTFAIAGYFDIAGMAERFSPYGRAFGSFKDPNVMGSYCTLGAVYALQLVLLQKSRHVALLSFCFLYVFAGILLTFSRGSLAALVLSVLMLVFFSYTTSHSRPLRRRITIGLMAMFGLLALGLAILMSNPEFRELLFQRAALVQDYDGGETGRFGSQLRSIPMLLDRLLIGFGPLQFRHVFELEPHNSYISAFANSGLAGGFTFFALVGLTSFVGFRLCIKASPYRSAAHVIWPPLFGHFLQGFQIDIDHWRFFYVAIGAIWALEAVRVEWAKRQV